jgi:hypothetical protein
LGFGRPSRRDSMKVAQHFSAGSGVWPFFQSLVAIFSGGDFERRVQGGGLNGGVAIELEVSRY